MIDSFIYLFLFYFIYLFKKKNLFIYFIKTNIFQLFHFLYEGKIVLGTVHFVFILFRAFYVFLFLFII